jgi:glucokinase
MKKYAIGTDIGGSHISCAVIDLEKEEIIKQSISTEKVDNKASADDILKKWSAVLGHSISTIDKSQLVGIGFAMPGPFDYEKGIALFSHETNKFEKLYGVNVAENLKKTLTLNDNCGLRFMNDASSFAVGEAWMGKAKGFDKSVSITLGTGFGSAFINKGIPVVEGDDVPKLGCVWHLPFGNSIADDYFSTRWYVNRYAEKSGKKLAGVKEIAGQVATDEHAAQVFVEFGDNLGQFLGPWLKKFKAGVLVIGGNISGAYNLFGNHFENSLSKQGIQIAVKISELKEDAALIGSARLFDDNFWVNVKHLLSKM